MCLSLLREYLLNNIFSGFGWGMEVVLGLEWLAGLGEIRANFEDLT